MRIVSLEGKLAAALTATSIAAAIAAALLVRWFDSFWLGVAATVLLLAFPALVFARAMASPVAQLMRALAGSVVAFRDGDFSFSIRANRRDEVGDLVVAHNDLGRVLREQRQQLTERELLLDTVVQNTPTALVLVESGGHVVYANLAARHLLHRGRSMTGERFDAIVAAAPAALADAIGAGDDGLFTVAGEVEEETFHLSQRVFKLHGKPQRLYQLKRLTRELARQEVSTWKKVIRVISHEINNSLAPIRSLSHSGRELARLGDRRRLAIVFDTVEERTRHLEAFIEGYARVAKLPQPQFAEVDWRPFLGALSRHYAFRVAGDIPQAKARFDRVQIEQALINLLKNAHEAGGAAAEVSVAVAQSLRDVRIEVGDRGSGMSDTVLANALLPFYSTKRSGSGVGLALVREIAEAHGGRVQLANRDGGGLVASLVLPQQAGAL